MEFQVLLKSAYRPDKGRNAVYLRVDHWNDYSFVTMFHMSVHDMDGLLHEIGEIKIGFKGQVTEVETFTRLPSQFENIDNEFFSLGQGVDFYKNIASLPNFMGKRILVALRDIVVCPDLIDDIKEEPVFSTSLLRSVSLSLIRGQYARVVEGDAELTDFKFKFFRAETEKLGGINLSFDVGANSIPSTNIHAVIGRNGVGKTTLLNGMIEAITNRKGVNSKFVETMGSQEVEIADDYFSNLVSVSFSAFDPFIPPVEQSDPAKGACYSYIGLKDQKDNKLHRTIHDLRNDCVKALINCFYNPKKTGNWLNAIERLGSDENFASMNLGQLEAVYRELRNTTINNGQSDSEEFYDKYKEKIDLYLSRMSSGHAIVLLTITRLVATVEEKTLVLLDEPESHLHPPLLAAFVRSLSDLLHDRNGVAIMATHSPVVLQEIPCSCVWKIYRVGKNVTKSRPSIETFGENVGVLTSEVFNLEVERSGFHDLLGRSVNAGGTYEEIVAEYDGQLGFEGRAILKALVANRDRKRSHDATK